MYLKEFIALCFLLIAQYVILFFNLCLPVIMVLIVGMVPVYFLFQKALKKVSKKEYLLDAYMHDIKILGLYVLLCIAVFVLLYIQEAFSFEGVFSLGLSLFIYCFIYLDFLRKKISAYHEYNEVQQGLMKACMALLFYLLYNIVYFGRW